MRRLPERPSWTISPIHSDSHDHVSRVPHRLQYLRSGRPYARRNPKLALRLLRATSRLGVPGAIPAPPELLPLGARVLAQGYLNRFALPLLNGWLLPTWMRRQTDPASPLFVPRSVHNLMINQTERNWTALGIPGQTHPIESIVDKHGLLTPVPGGPSLDWWVRIEKMGAKHVAPSTVAPSDMQVVQRFQDGLPVVVSAYEMSGLRVSSEVWMLPHQQGDWAAMQVVLFNIADLPLSGAFMFALRPYNPEGISPIYNISFNGATLRADGHSGPFTWPKPEGYALSTLSSGDLFQSSEFQAKSSRSALEQGEVSKVIDPHGFAHGVLCYRFSIEPWEEAEFLAFMPVHTRKPDRQTNTRPLFSTQTSDVQSKIQSPDPQLYSRLKATTTLEWRSLLESGMRLSLPHRDLQASWEANRAHVLSLHDGDIITPGPDIYHNFWLRDATYMAHALSICGYVEAAVQLLRGFVKWQRRDGLFTSHRGEWDSTGQALWAIGQHLALHPDAALEAEFRPAVARGSRWITHTLARSPDGLMPPGISSEHLGPPDRYYWDNLWSLAGLKATEQLLGPITATRSEKAAARLRHNLNKAWQADIAALGRQAIPAAPGRGIDLGMIGNLVASFPLSLVPDNNPLLHGTLDALQESTFYEGALFVNTGHSGWGTYLNMRIAGCYILQGSPKGWEMMRRLLKLASPTFNWPEAIHPHSLGGSAGDGHHGWASAEWLMLVRAMLLQEKDETLTITPALPKDWLVQSGQISVENAPTHFGPLSYNIEWDDGGHTIRLQLDTAWRTTPKEILWKLPVPLQSATADGIPISPNQADVLLPPSAKAIEVERIAKAEL